MSLASATLLLAQALVALALGQSVVLGIRLHRRGYPSWAGVCATVVVAIYVVGTYLLYDVVAYRRLLSAAALLVVVLALQAASRALPLSAR